MKYKIEVQQINSDTPEAWVAMLGLFDHPVAAGNECKRIGDENGVPVRVIHVFERGDTYRGMGLVREIYDPRLVGQPAPF